MNSESHSGGMSGVAVQTRALHVAVPTSTGSDSERTSSSYRNNSHLRTGRLDSAQTIFSTHGRSEHTSDLDDEIDVTLDLVPPTAAIKTLPANPATTEIVSPELAAPVLTEIKTSAAPQAVFEVIAAAEGVMLRDRYLLGRVVGTGGNGVVYQARDLRREKSGSHSHDIAIKVLRDEFDADRRALARLKREFAHAQELSHPNIVRVYDIDCHNDLWFITMELLDGRTLADVLRDPALSQDRHVVTASIAACATAMQYAHSRGILHCDFKPSNIFLTRDGEVKLLDFGAACEYGPQAAQVRTTRSATLAYASPQVLRCERPDPRDDIYSLACVSYEWLTGQHPFERRSSAHAMANGMQLRKLPGLTQRQYGALKQALSWEREERPETVADFCRALGVDETEREAGMLRFPEWLKSVDRGATARIAATAALLAVTLLTVLALPSRHPDAHKELIHATSASMPLPHRVSAAVIASAQAGPADTQAKVRGADLHSTLLPVMPQHDLGDSLRRVSIRMFGTNGEPSALQPIAWHTSTATSSDEGAAMLPPTETSPTKSVEKPAPRVPSQIVALQDVSITVSSRASMAVVPLVRRNGESGVLRVKWRTLPGSAKPDVDYRTVTAGTVNFLNSQANQVLYVPLVNADRRGNRSFIVELQSIAGGARLDNTMTAHITIRDDG